jgi:hypothetical protein
MAEETQRHHIYHAEVHALASDPSSAHASKVTPQAFIKLSENGGKLSGESKDFHSEGISYVSAHTEVSGHHDAKDHHGWNTVTTVVIEKLNVRNVLTADRVVGKIETSHPAEGYVPTVTFSGTHFENLRISGQPVKVDLDLDMLGPKPGIDAGYLNEKNFRTRVTSQHESVRKHGKLPPKAVERFKELPPESTNVGSLECSLVKHAGGVGHVIDVPNFGQVYLAVVKLEQSKDHHPHQHEKGKEPPIKTLIKLTMVEVHLDEAKDAVTPMKASRLAVGEMETNGGTRP